MIAWLHDYGRDVQPSSSEKKKKQVKKHEMFYSGESFSSNWSLLSENWFDLAHLPWRWSSWLHGYSRVKHKILRKPICLHSLITPKTWSKCKSIAINLFYTQAIKIVSFIQSDLKKWAFNSEHCTYYTSSLGWFVELYILIFMSQCGGHNWFKYPGTESPA